MSFPVYFHLLGLRIHPHLVMELLGYSLGFQLFLRARRRDRRLSMSFEVGMWLVVGAIFGAFVGSKLLAWVESANIYWPHRDVVEAWVGGKTIVGGLLGGWIGVEVAKRMLGYRIATGDLYVLPLAVGISLGRVGCFLTGLDDQTHGNPTHLPWAVNFGDGVGRHPTQLYEVVFLIALAGVLAWRARRPHEDGRIFRLFMLAYLCFRFASEFIKPSWKPWAGLSAIQIACLAGAAACAWQLWHPHGNIQGADHDPTLA